MMHVKEGSNQKIDRIKPAFKDPAAPALAEIIKRYGKITVKEIADGLAYPDSIIDICLKIDLMTVKNANEVLLVDHEYAECRIKNNQKEA